MVFIKQQTEHRINKIAKYLTESEFEFEIKENKIICKNCILTYISGKYLAYDLDNNLLFQTSSIDRTMSFVFLKLNNIVL